MKHKKHLVVNDLDDDIIQNEDPDTEIVDGKSCEVEYDTEMMMTFAIDGVLPFIDNEESRLVFFTNIPSVGNIDDKVKKFHNICVVELRTTPSCMKRIFSIISSEMDKYSRFDVKKKAIEDGLKKHGQQNHIMYR